MNLSVSQRWTIHCLLLIMVAAGQAQITGCDRSSASAPPTTIEGAWLGDGEFRASRGTMAVKAQLELLSDGSYRYLILEPAILMLTGVETGTWTRDAQTLTLTPGVFERDESGSVFQHLRDSSPDASRPPRDLTIATNLADLRFRDSQLDLTFRYNHDATAELRASGEVAAP